jgi:hypothetical protein
LETILGNNVNKIVPKNNDFKTKFTLKNVRNIINDSIYDFLDFLLIFASYKCIMLFEIGLIFNAKRYFLLISTFLS